jgi:hypothetical protein
MSKPTDENKREIYQLVAQSYLSDGIYMWEDLDASCDTLEGCGELMDYYIQEHVEYTGYIIEKRIITTVFETGYQEGW